MQSWPDGLERVRTTHCRGLFRQIPQPFAWNSALYLSKHGTAIRKFYNYVTGDWSWATEPTEPVEDSESGRMGLNLCGHWTPLETCIALAWRRRHPDSTAPAIRHGPHRKLSASNLLRVGSVSVKTDAWYTQSQNMIRIEHLGLSSCEGLNSSNAWTLKLRKYCA